MNFAERMVAGPPVLATVGRRAKVGDVVWSTASGRLYEVTETFPAIVGSGKGYEVASLEDGLPNTLTHRQAVVLTQAEAKAAREHFASIAETLNRASMDAEVDYYQKQENGRR